MICWAKRIYKRNNGLIIKTTTYAYNYQNQPVEIKENGEVIAQYGYDTSKQRIYKRLAKTGEERVYNWDAAGHRGYLYFHFVKYAILAFDYSVK